MRLASIVFAVAALVTAVACGPGRTTFARYPGASVEFDRVAQDAKALEIADRVIAAAGGAERWAAAKQLRWSQSVTQDGKEIIGGEQAWDRWNGRHHGRARREGGDLVVMRGIYDESGHAFVDREHRLRRIEGGAAQAIAVAKERWEFDTAILFMPFLLEEPGTKLAYAGEMQSDDGKTLDVLTVTFDPKDKTRLATYQVAVDRETNLIARIEIQNPGKGENERLGYALGQWLEGGGLKFPGTVQNIGYASEVVTFKDLSVSGDPDDTLFVPPL